MLSPVLGGTRTVVFTPIRVDEFELKRSTEEMTATEKLGGFIGCLERSVVHG